MMMKNFLSRLPQSFSGKTRANKFVGTAVPKAAFSTQIVGANGRRLPLPDDKPLKEFDPDMAELLLKEQKRQFRGIELIASENFASRYTL